MILAEAKGRLPDGTNDPRLEIGPATDMVVHFTCPGVHEEPVDREIAAFGILGGRRKGDAGRVPAIGIGRVGAERRHLDLTAPPRSDDGDHPKRRADGECPRPPEQRANDIRPGRGGDVVIGRRPAEELVTNTPSGPQRLIPVGAEPIDDAPRELPRLDRIGCNGCHGDC